MYYLYTHVDLRIHAEVKEGLILNGILPKGYNWADLIKT